VYEVPQTQLILHSLFVDAVPVAKFIWLRIVYNEFKYAYVAYIKILLHKETVEKKINCSRDISDS